MKTNDSDPVKQVIVIRKDLKMRRGKEIAQGSHASMKFLTRRLQEPRGLLSTILQGMRRFISKETRVFTSEFTLTELEWVKGRFAKVCLRVDSEEELLDLYAKAKSSGLVVELVTDAGKTEFHGIPTNTCIAVGPDRASKIDKITGHLKLY